MSANRFLVVTMMAGSLAGCSVGMALSGEETPDLSVVKVGALQDDVELQLGAPEAVDDLPDGMRKATYSYEVGNDPNAVRAIGHGALDVASVGLWEVIGTPIEYSIGDERQVFITYDEAGKVTAIEQ